MVMDNVKCTNCGFDGLVDLGTDICPKCNTEGSLAWKEGEEPEVNTLELAFKQMEREGIDTDMDTWTPKEVIILFERLETIASWLCRARQNKKRIEKRWKKT